LKWIGIKNTERIFEALQHEEIKTDTLFSTATGLKPVLLKIKQTP
jgi:hypothetical protein